MIKYTFSGHESFQCKNLWLKKGYDFVKSGKSFNENMSVVDLGVGKNMVASVKYWLKAFALLDENNQLNDFAHRLFDDENGLDPFVEDLGTAWLLHYKLIVSEHATLYHLTFREFHSLYREFNREQLQKFIKRKCSEIDIQYPYNENTVKTDIGVLLKTYVKPDSSTKTFEDFTSLLIDLELLLMSKRPDTDNKMQEWFRFFYQDAKRIAPQIALFIILDYCGEDKVIDFITIADLFRPLCFTTDAVMDILDNIIQLYPSQIVYSDDAGIRQVQILKQIDKWAILTSYYNQL